MRRTIWAAILVLGLVAAAALAYQGRLRGSVVDRDGNPQQRVKVEFYTPGAETAAFSAWTDSEGRFYLNSPRNGAYRATVRAQDFTVRIDDKGLHPPTLVVE